MTIRSMTAFAQVKAPVDGAMGYTLSLKSVNHRYLEVQLRMPVELGGLEMKMRATLKEFVARGRIEAMLNFEVGAEGEKVVNHALLKSYVAAFRSAAAEYGINAQPDLNQLLKQPGAFIGATPAIAADGELEASVQSSLKQAIARLNQMREEEGRGLEDDLRRHMRLLDEATAEVGALRAEAARCYLEKMQSRMSELIGEGMPQDRILQEAALLAERRDVEEETVRMRTHIQHFLGLLDAGGEVGKKLDFLLQEMNREANTLLAKTSGVAGQGIRITELGLAMKAEIEKAREQAQNIE